MTYEELIEECKKRGFTLVDDNGKFSVLDKKGKKSPLNSEEVQIWKRRSSFLLFRIIGCFVDFTKLLILI